MNDREKLQIIKRKAQVFNTELREIDMEEYVDWLIEQAEKVEQLSQEIERLKKFLNWEQEEAQWLDEEVTFQLEQLKQMQTKIDRYEKALQKIIDESICKCVDCDFGDTCYAVIARKALDGEEV